MCRRLLTGLMTRSMPTAGARVTPTSASLRGEVLEILAAAEARDEQADARDTAARKRDSAASLHSFLNDDEYDATLKARRSAAMDRSDSRTDRDSSAEDRSRLTERLPASETE